MHNHHSRSLGCRAASGHSLNHLVREYRDLTDNLSIRCVTMLLIIWKRRGMSSSCRMLNECLSARWERIWCWLWVIVDRWDSWDTAEQCASVWKGEDRPEGNDEVECAVGTRTLIKRKKKGIVKWYGIGGGGRQRMWELNVNAVQEGKELARVICLFANFKWVELFESLVFDYTTTMVKQISE